MSSFYYGHPGPARIAGDTATETGRALQSSQCLRGQSGATPPPTCIGRAVSHAPTARGDSAASRLGAANDTTAGMQSAEPISVWGREKSPAGTRCPLSPWGWGEWVAGKPFRRGLCFGDFQCACNSSKGDRVRSGWFGSRTPSRSPNPMQLVPGPHLPQRLQHPLVVVQPVGFVGCRTSVSREGCCCWTLHTPLPKSTVKSVVHCPSHASSPMGEGHFKFNKRRSFRG